MQVFRVSNSANECSTKEMEVSLQAAKSGVVKGSPEEAVARDPTFVIMTPEEVRRQDGRLSLVTIAHDTRTPPG